MSNHKFKYNWLLKQGYPSPGIKKHSKTVFGTFICGGGSTMGYKLAGYNHLGGVEIDPEVADVYQTNHDPKLLYNEDIRDFIKRDYFPNELKDLDLLDGSPPCSSFSMSGSREDGWGKEKVFREGQSLQKLDDLFFEYIKLAEKLKPKIVLAENVKGLIQGNAKSYVSRITREFTNSGYSVQLFLLNAATMGVPQKRERVFFICQRNDLDLPKLSLNFNEPPIPFGKIVERNCKSSECFNFPESERIRLEYAKRGDKSFQNADMRYRGKSSFFNQIFLYDNNVANTITGQDKSYYFDEKRRISNNEAKLIGSFPMDYNFKDINPKYLIGMSVPPIMTAQIAHQIYLQWLSKI